MVTELQRAVPRLRKHNPVHRILSREYAVCRHSHIPWRMRAMNSPMCPGKLVLLGEKLKCMVFV